MECVSLIQELNQGKELAKQLRNHLRPSSSSSSDGFLLIDRILRSYENALTVLAAEPAAVKSAAAPMNAAVKDRVSSNSPNSKKRKAMTKWSEQVKVRSDSAVEGPLGDGFSWRKYGQKDILGSKFPRSYFRCSHRFAQGCLATKQVQKSENDPTMYEITYNGNHTCNKVIQNTPKEEQKPLLEHPISPKQEQKPLHQQQDEPSCLSFSSDTIRVKSENLDNVYTDLCRRPFQFGSDFQDDQSPFRESDLSPTFENDIFESCCDFETGFISVPNSFTNVSIGELEEYCNLDNLELFC